MGEQGGVKRAFINSQFHGDLFEAILPFCRYADFTGKSGGRGPAQFGRQIGLDPDVQGAETPGRVSSSSSPAEVETVVFIFPAGGDPMAAFFHQAAPERRAGNGAKGCPGAVAGISWRLPSRARVTWRAAQSKSAFLRWSRLLPLQGSTGARLQPQATSCRGFPARCGWFEQRRQARGFR